MQLSLDHLSETELLATWLAQRTFQGFTLFLIGDLGSGKTTFTQFFARELGVTEVVNSPTFNIHKPYQGREYLLNHFDLYRLEGNCQGLGLLEIFESGVNVVEWANFGDFGELPALVLHLSYDGEQRKGVLRAQGAQYQAIVEELQASGLFMCR